MGWVNVAEMQTSSHFCQRLFLKWVSTQVFRPGLAQLSQISHALDERLNRLPDKGAPYVGERAFSHKGGLHVSAVEKDPKSYEHVPPESVGNRRHVVVSDQSGKSNILAMFRDVGIEVDANDPKVVRLVEIVKEQEYMGYAYDGAEASFELLARRTVGDVPDFYRLKSFRVIDERRWNARNELVTLSEATIKAQVGQKEIYDGCRRQWPCKCAGFRAAGGSAAALSGAGGSAPGRL